LKKLDCDYVVLGGGPAGYYAAITGAKLGAKVTLIEKSNLGGVCLNQGCIPTKALLRTSGLVRNFKKSLEFGIESQIKNTNWLTSVERKNRVVKTLRIGLENLISSNKINLVNGIGTLKNQNQLHVNAEDEEKIINFNKLVIATGAVPIIPQIEGVDLEGVLTSDDILDLTEIPKSLVIIGSGVIGLEFAEMFSPFCNVTVLEIKDTLDVGDLEISNELLKILKRKGINFKFGVNVKKITKEGSLRVYFEEKSKESFLTADKVLLAVGRKPNITSDFVDVGLDILNNALQVDESYRTNIENIYAAGDVIGGRQLAHLSFAEGRAAILNAMGKEGKVNYEAVPICIYTSPEVAMVGLTEKEAIEKGYDVKIGKFYFRNNGRALTLGERDGLVKVVTDKRNNKILGCQILGEGASELISEITLAITLKADLNTLASMIHPHPTLSEAVFEAINDALGLSVHKI